jgi:putative transcriptional regulator
LKLGNRIRRFRFDRNELSQEELAAAVDVTRQTIISIEKGKFVPSTLLAMRIARFFGKSIEDVFYLIEEDKNE